MIESSCDCLATQRVSSLAHRSASNKTFPLFFFIFSSFTQSDNEDKRTLLDVDCGSKDVCSAGADVSDRKCIASCNTARVFTCTLKNIRQIKTIEISLVRLAVVRCTSADGV